MFCAKCGKELKDGTAFCSQCGAAVSNGLPPSMQPEQPQKAKPTGGKMIRLIILGIIIAAAVTAITIAAVKGIGNSSKQNKDSDILEEAVADDKQETSDDGEAPAADDSRDSAEAAGEAETEIQQLDDGIARISPDTMEGKLQEQILHMNDASYTEASIDVYARNYPVGARNASATWDNTVFYCLEGYQTVSGYQDKNVCTLTKKELHNASTGNIMEYEIYFNPSTNAANKIVSIEYLADGLEVTEYYYGNDHKVSFIFQYTTDNYISTFATPDKMGERYLFNNDCMVTWRSITASGTINYILGDAEVERMKNQFARLTMAYYDSLDNGGQAAFDETEERMLNAAYNTYNTVLGSDGIAHIQGYVYDGNNTGIKQAVVELYASDFSTLIYSTATDDSGMYTIYVPTQVYEYNIRVSKDNMTSADIYLIGMSNDQIGAYQDSVYLFDETAGEALLQLTLGDAFTYAEDGSGMIRLVGAVVNFRRGINNRNGEIVLQTMADSSGYLSVELFPGIYTIEVNASGYETMYYTVVVNSVTGTSIYEFYATPTLYAGEYAIVLTWGSSPADLDSHLFTTVGTSADHIWFGDRNDIFNSYLDVDDTDSYGPETVTIRNFDASSYYKYCIVDYTNCSYGAFGSYEMSYSMACVNVYSSDGLIATYNVPTGKPGVVWEVFEIRNGRLTPIQRYYSNVQDETWWHDEK